jgi:DNA invertase Pin-like site-specific DNA recombinase
MSKFIAYFRVSTKRQGQSGLGIAAQRETVGRFAANGSVVAEYTEVESGKRDDRQQLAKAIAHAKAEGARLVIAKLDRLSRNAAHIFMLRDAGVDFVVCDAPEMNTLTVGFLAVIAQHERETISARTSASLQARKAKIKTSLAEAIGADSADDASVAAAYRELCQAEAIRKGLTTDVLPIARANAIASKKADAASCREGRMAGAFVQQARQANPSLSLRSIAEMLNSQGYTTRNGGQFAAQTVKRLIERV